MKIKRKVLRKILWLLFLGVSLGVFISCPLNVDEPDETVADSLDDVRPVDSKNDYASLTYGHFFVSRFTAADLYHIQITSADDREFDTVLFEEAECETNDIFLPELGLPAGDYLWRVRARAGDVWGSWSDAVSMHSSSGVSGLNFIESDRVNDVTPLFDWDDIEGATYYEVRMTIDDDVQYYRTYESSYQVLESQSFDPGDQVLYQIRPVFSISRGSSTAKGFWCDTRDLMIEPSHIVLSDYSAYYIDWEDVPGVSTYEIWISDIKDFGDDTHILDYDHEFSQSRFDVTGLQAGTYYVKIQPTTEVGSVPEWSQVIEFIKTDNVEVEDDHQPQDVEIGVVSSLMNSATLEVRSSVTFDSYRWWLNGVDLYEAERTLILEDLEENIYSVSVICEKDGYQFSDDFVLERTGIVAITPPSGEYCGAQTIEISCTGADELYYAFEPISEDLDNASLYVNPFEIDSAMTIYATAVENGKIFAHEVSSEITLIPEIDLVLSAVSEDEATFTVDSNISIDEYTWYVGGVLQNGETGENLSLTNLTEDQYVVSVSTVVNSKTYTDSFGLKRLEPVQASPAAGTYYKAQTITLECEASEEIYYAFGPIQEDLGNAVKYTEPFLLSESKTIHAVAFRSSKLQSHEVTHEFDIQKIDVDIDTSELESSSVVCTVNTSVAVDSYQWYVNGEETGTDSKTVRLSNLDENRYPISMMVTKGDCQEIASIELMRVDPVVISSAPTDPNTDFGSQTVTLTCEGADAIEYTMNSQEETYTTYTTPFEVDATTTVFAKGVADGMLKSSMRSKIIKVAEPEVSIFLIGRTGNTASFEACTNYTPSSYNWFVDDVLQSQHTKTLSLTNVLENSYTIRVVTGTGDDEASDSYTLGRVSEVEITPEGGTYSGRKLITLVCNDAKSIYYGYQPLNDDLSNASIYSKPFYLEENRTIYAVARANDKLDSHSSSESFEILDWHDIQDMMDGLSDPDGLNSDASQQMADVERAPKTLVESNQGWDACGAPITYKTEKYHYKASANFDQQMLLNPSADVIYPGSVLVGSSIMDGTYKEVVSGTKRPITISYDLTGVTARDGSPGTVTGTFIPSLSSYRTLHNSIMDQSIPPQSSCYSFEKNEIYKEDDFSIKLGSNVTFSLGPVYTTIENGFNFETENSMNKIMIQFMETFYTVDVDQGGDTFLYQDIDLNDFQGERPVYVSSIAYGRLAYLTLETSRSLYEVGVDFGIIFGAFDGLVENGYEVGSARTRIDEESNLNITVIGSNVVATDMESFMDMVQNNGFSSSNPGEIIAYKLRYVDDNSVANVVFNQEYDVLKKVEVEGEGIDVKLRIPGLDCYIQDSGSNCELFGDVTSEQFGTLWSYPLVNYLDCPENGHTSFGTEYITKRFNNRNETITILSNNLGEAQSGRDDMFSPQTITFSVGDVLNGVEPETMRLTLLENSAEYVEFNIDATAEVIY